jgi:hypothetical protein
VTVNTQNSALNKPDALLQIAMLDLQLRRPRVKAVHALVQTRQGVEKSARVLIVHEYRQRHPENKYSGF